MTIRQDIIALLGKNHPIGISTHLIAIMLKRDIRVVRPNLRQLKLRKLIEDYKEPHNPRAKFWRLK